MRYFPRTIWERWQRLSIRYKLLVPIVIAVVLAILFLIAGASGPIQGLVENLARNATASRLDALNQSVGSYLDTSRRDILSLTKSLEIQDLAATSSRHDIAVQTRVLQTLSGRFNDLLTADQLPYTDLRYISLDGNQLLLTKAPGFDNIDQTVFDPVNKIFEGLLAITPTGKVYVLRPELRQGSDPSNSRPEVVVQIGASVYYNGKRAGAVIGSLRLGSFLLDTFRPNTSDLYQFSIALLDQQGDPLVVNDPSITNGIAVLGDPALKLFDAPFDQLQSSPQDNLELNAAAFSSRSLDTFDSKGFENFKWTLVIRRTQAASVIRVGSGALTSLLIRFLIVLALLLIATVIVGQVLTRPLVDAAKVARRVAAGELQARVAVQSSDEIGQLGTALNIMTERLGQTVSGLEVRIAQRTRDLETVAEISGQAVQAYDRDELLNRSVEAIRNRFDFYQVQVFLIDDAGENAVLVASSGVAAKEMLDRAHKLAVGSASIVGKASQTGRPFITLDTQHSDVPHRYNPLLPLTRSEMALPMRTSKALIGALDIQSVNPDAFDDVTVKIFQVLADQIASALENVRLAAESNRRLRDIETLNRQTTREAWDEYVEGQDSQRLAFQYDLLNLNSIDPDQSNGTDSIQTPIKVRGETLGSLSVKEDPNLPLSNDDQEIIQAVADRVALAIENARLVERTQNALTEVEKLYFASRALGKANELEDIYSLTADQLATFEFVDRFLVLAARPDPKPNPAYFEYVHTWERTPLLVKPFRVGGRLPREAVPLRWLGAEGGPPIPFMADMDNDLVGYEASRKIFQMAGVQSILLAPLATSSRWFGILQCHSQRPKAFTPGFIKFIGAMADQVAIAIENRLLFEEAQAEARRNRALAEATQLSSQIGIDFEAGVTDLFNAVAQSSGYDRWWFGQLTTTSTGAVLSRVAARFEPSSPLNETTHVFLETDQTALAEAARIGELVLVNDPVDHHLLSTLPYGIAHAYGKHIATPVRVGGKMVGTLMLGRSSNGADLGDRDIQLTTTLSTQIAVAWENRRLFSVAETERQTLQSVISTLPTGVMVLDALTREVIITNDQARLLLGLDEIAPYQRFHTSTKTLYTEDEFPPNIVLATVAPVYAQDITVYNSFGQRTDLIASAAPIIDREGKLISAVAVFQDVTELRELESELQDSLRETTTLYEISRTIAAENEAETILAAVAKQLQTLFTPDYLLAVFTDHRQPQKIAEIFQVDFSDLEMPGVRRIEGDDIPVPRSILLDNVFAESDLSQHPTLASDTHLQDLQLSSIAVFPFRARSRVVGWLIIGFKTNKALTSEDRRFIGTMADQTAIGVDSARLAQETSQSLSEATLLYEATYAINRADSVQTIVQIITDQFRNFAPTQIDIFLVNTRHKENTIDWVVHWDANDPLSGELRVTDAPIFEDWQLIEAGPYFIEDVSTGSFQNFTLLQRMPNWGQFIAQTSVPLSVKGRPTGRLVVSFNRPYRFGQIERQFVTTVADQAAIVIDNISLVQQTQETLEETATLYQTNRAITNAAELLDVIHAIIDHAAPPVVSRAILARLLSDSWTAENASVEIIADWGQFSGIDLLDIRFTPDQLPIWPQLSSPNQLWIEDLSHSDVEPSAQAIYQLLSMNSVIVLPLIVAGRIIGALMLGSANPWPRTEREARIYSALADQTAISMESRDLLQQAQRRARQLQTSAQVSKAAASILDLDELFNNTVNLIQDRFRYDHVQIFLVNANNTDAVLMASTGDAGQQLLAIHHHLGVGSQSVIGQVTATGQAQLAADTTDRRVIHKPNPYLPRTRSELALPLIARNRILGALDVQSNEPGTFTDEDEAVLANLADQIAIAIDNAGLFVLSTRRAEEMRFLFDVTRVATEAPSEAEDAFRRIAELVKHTLQSDIAVLLLLDDTGTRLVPYSASHDADLPASGAFDLNTPEFQRWSTNSKPVVYNDTTTVPYLQIVSAYLGSAATVPLFANDSLVGVINVAKRIKNGFDDDAVRLLETLGSTLVAILQNARLLREVQAANIRLREVDKLKSQFLANMSHELRTPLNSIIGFSRVILKGIDGPLTDTQSQDLETIHESGKHLLGLVNDILDQAKIEANKMELTYSYFSAVDLIKGVMATASGLVKDKPVRLHQEIELHLASVWGDEFRTRQVLLNLVSNASKFTTQGGVTVSAFGVEQEGRAYVQISVTDTGIGIPRDKLDSVFEAFQQVENSTARQYEGTGLGLPIAKSLVEMQGGRIWVDSELGIGSTFSFTIPLGPTETVSETRIEPLGAEIVNELSDAITRAEKPQPAQRIIVVIDDEIGAVSLYRRYLTKAGYEVIGGKPEEAEDLAVAYKPRVILLDVNMPGRSGWDVLKDLKEHDDTFKIPVIICTVEADRERAFRLGASDYLLKDFDEQTLIDAIKRIELERDRRKILIVDDKPDSVRLIREAFAGDDRFKVYEAEDGQQALEKIHHYWPDLVILDLRMPEMDGFDVLNTLHSNPDTANLPVLIITADDVTDDERDHLNGVKVYRKATIDPKELLEYAVSQLQW